MTAGSRGPHRSRAPRSGKAERARAQLEGFLDRLDQIEARLDALRDVLAVIDYAIDLRTRS